MFPKNCKEGDNHPGNRAQFTVPSYFVPYFYPQISEENIRKLNGLCIRQQPSYSFKDQECPSMRLIEKISMFALVMELEIISYRKNITLFEHDTKLMLVLHF